MQISNTKNPLDPFPIIFITSTYLTHVPTMSTLLPPLSSSATNSGDIDQDKPFVQQHRTVVEKPHAVHSEERLMHKPFSDGDVGHQARPIEPTGFYKNIGNPGVLGLAAHAVTLMLISTQFMRWRGVGNPQVYIGNLYFMAGTMMLLTAQWCLVKGETFAYTVFGVFSGFYLSYAAILTPAFNVTATYSGVNGSGNGTAELYQSLGIFLMVWNGVFTIIFIASLRTNLALAVVFFGVAMGVFLLGAMYFTLARVELGGGGASLALALSKSGGAFLFLSASSGFYLVLVQLLESVDWPWVLPVCELDSVWKGFRGKKQ